MKFSISFSLGKDNKKKEAPIVPVESADQVKVIHEPFQEENKEELYEAIRKVFREENEKYRDLPTTTNQTNEMPISPGRVSLYEGFRNFIPNSNSPVPTTFNFRTLGLIKHLSMYNPHFSMAVENIVTLGNTDYQIEFGKTVLEQQAEKYRKYLWERIQGWYEFADGEDSLDNDLLAQLCNYGAISAEAVIRPDMRGIQNIVRVDPEYVRFAYDSAKNIHIPLQEIAGVLANNKTSKYPGYIELNPNTYCYMAMMRMGEMPYAIPPFLSAIESVFIENDMVKNFQNMMKRLGMMGFLSVLVNAPVKLAGESSDNYSTRLAAYLEKLRPGVEHGFSRGIVMGFKDTHEFQVHAPMNPAAADQAMNMIQALVFAGLKQDPNMQGKNYSVTETFGRVLLEKMTYQVANKQRILASFKARIFKLELLLNGIRVPDLVVKYKKAATSDDLREEQIRAVKISNTGLLLQAGIIDQQMRARELGYDEPAEDAPLESETVQIAKLKVKTGGKGKESNSIERIKKKLNAGLPPFDYFVPDGCGPLDLIKVGDFPEKAMHSFVKKYLIAVDRQFNSALKLAQNDIVREMDLLPQNAPQEQVLAGLLFGLIKGWDNNFSSPVQDIVENNVVKIYDHYRRDESIFTQAEGFSKPSAQNFFVIPPAVFDLLDYRAIEFLESIDKIYLGKFITDPDTEKRIITWLKQRFESGNIPIGRDSSMVLDFVREFTGVVQLENWKIRRIIETTANRSRNLSNVQYLQQALITEYEVVEVMDDKTCAWCRHMNHQKFSVRQTVDQYDKVIKSGINELPTQLPFATSVKLEQFVKMDARQIQAKGMSLPSYHPHCRGRIVAHFKN